MITVNFFLGRQNILARRWSSVPRVGEFVVLPAGPTHRVFAVSAVLWPTEDVQRAVVILDTAEDRMPVAPGHVRPPSAEVLAVAEQLNREIQLAEWERAR